MRERARTQPIFALAPNPLLAPLLAPLLIPLLGCALLATASCAHREEKPPEATAPSAEAKGAAPAAAGQAAWAQKMQSLSTALSDLLPIVASPQKFAAAKNQARIETDVKALRALAHSLSQGAAPPNGDPSMTLVSGLFAEDIDRALESLHSNNKEYARAILKDAANYCVSCHTQADNGPSFPRLSLDIKVKDLPRLERADFFAATRQFDLALEELTAALKDPSLAAADPFAWEKAARSALAIAVRVQKNPATATDLVELILRAKRAPGYVQKSAQHWLKSLKEWKKEREPSSPKPAESLARAAALVNRAQAAQKYPLDHSQDVLWFRAGALLHEILGQPALGAAEAGRALYLAGVAAEATRDMNFWTMHETYFELCIKRAPHGKQAQQCFDRLNDSVTLGYSGSAGILIPPDVRKRLEGLRALAASKSESAAEQAPAQEGEHPPEKAPEKAGEKAADGGHAPKAPTPDN